MIEEKEVSEISIVDYAEPYGYIYMIKNKVNGKIYIGQTTDKRGYRADLTLSQIKYNYNPHLYNSFAKYGRDCFVIKIVDSGKDQEELNQKEEYYIQKYNTLDQDYGYNIRHGGSHGKHSEEAKERMSQTRKGSVLSEEHRRKIGEAKKGNILSEDHKRRISKANKGNKHFLGRKHSEETKRKMSEAKKGEKHYNYGNNHSEETKKKISKALKGRVFSEETKRKMSEARKGYLAKKRV
ncbi:MAG: NUMOD3 domain-containing DNA-binding protein [Candidatus Helarchaeota archaeon]